MKKRFAFVVIQHQKKVSFCVIRRDVKLVVGGGETVFKIYFMVIYLARMRSKVNQSVNIACL